MVECHQTQVIEEAREWTEECYRRRGDIRNRRREGHMKYRRKAVKRHLRHSRYSEHAGAFVRRTGRRPRGVVLWRRRHITFAEAR